MKHQGIKAEELRERVQIEAPVTVESTSGAKTTSFETEDTVWASVIQKASRELRGESIPQVVLRNEYEVKIRYYPSLTTRHQLVWEGKTLSIAGIVSDARKTEMVLACVGRGDQWQASSSS